MKRNEYLSIALILVAGLLVYVGGSEILGVPLFKKKHPTHYVRPVESKEVGKLLPAFDILLPDSSAHIDLGKIPAGKPIVLFYFSPDCPYCQAEVTEIVENIDELKDIQFYLFTPFSFRDMKLFYERFELGKYPNIRTGLDYKFFFGPYFSAGSVPFLAIYDGNKRLRATFIGNVRYDQIKEVAKE